MKRRAGPKLRHGNVVNTNLFPFPALILLGKICPLIVTVGAVMCSIPLEGVSISAHHCRFKVIIFFKKKYSWNVKKRVIPSGV